MPTRDQTVKDACEIFETALYPAGIGPDNAWLGIYQALLWYEPVKLLDHAHLPHIIDADKLRPPKRKRRTASQTSLNAWQRRAVAIEQYLATQLGIPAADVRKYMDKLLRKRTYRGLQRQNPLGIAFPGLVKHVLEKLGNRSISYRTEVEANEIFPGISMPGRSTAPKIDILAFKQDKPRVIVSCKWSLRHDRINDITNECPIYKAAAMRSRTDLLFVVVTNEYDPARLNKVVIDSCVDAVVHVHKPAVVSVCGLNTRMKELVDLGNFVEHTSQW